MRRGRGLAGGSTGKDREMKEHRVQTGALGCRRWGRMGEVDRDVGLGS